MSLPRCSTKFRCFFDVSFSFSGDFIDFPISFLFVPCFVLINVYGVEYPHPFHQFTDVCLVRARFWLVDWSRTLSALFPCTCALLTWTLISHLLLVLQQSSALLCFSDLGQSDCHATVSDKVSLNAHWVDLGSTVHIC